MATSSVVSPEESQVDTTNEFLHVKRIVSGENVCRGVRGMRMKAVNYLGCPGHAAVAELPAPYRPRTTNASAVTTDGVSRSSSPDRHEDDHGRQRDQITCSGGPNQAQGSRSA